MSGPLGTTVFQVPKLGETGFRIDQVNEQKRKQAQQQLEKEVSATGAEKAYMENAQGLTGIYKQIADAEFQVFQQAAINYEKTGSAAAEAKMKQAASELTYAVSAGRAILDNASQEYVKNKANGFKDVALSPKEASELYSGFTNRTGEIIVKNGQVMVKDGDAFIPATQSTYLQSSVNLNNSLILPRVVQQGKFVDPDVFVNDVRGAISAGSSVENAKSRVNTLFDEKKKDPNFQADILTAYAISKDDGLGMVDDPSKLSADMYNEIQQLADNEEIVAQAEAWYRERVLNSVPPRWKATGTGGGGFGISIGGGTSKDLMFIENETIATSPIKKEGDKYVIDTEAKTVDVDFDIYTRFQSNLQGKSYTDAKQFQYDIVGIGVKDGKLYADKESSEQERGFFSSDGREYKRKAEPMTLSELSGLPTETRELIFGYLGGKEKVESMVRGKSVTSQENNKSDDSAQKLRETLKSQGFSDEDIESIISSN
jgi:hypothetical protein